MNVKEENTLVFLNVHLFFSSDFFWKAGWSFLKGRAADHPSHLHFLDRERKLQEFITESCKPCKLQTEIFVDQIFVISCKPCKPCKLGYSWIKSLAHSKDDLNVPLA